MRVIAGELRGRRLTAPPGTAVRPTSDRVREAVFDILFSLGGVEGLRVVDLFAGSGALGIEALSRGATGVTFVDRDVAAVEVVRANLVGVGRAEAERAGEVSVVRADATAWAGTTAAAFDLAFCDPPYDFDGWEALLAVLPADLAVLETGGEPPPVDGWDVLRSRRYGGTIVTVVRPAAAARKGAR